METAIIIKEKPHGYIKGGELREALDKLSDTDVVVIKSETVDHYYRKNGDDIIATYKKQ